MSALAEVLAECGYEPSIEGDGTMRLRSCPFHALAEQNREIVCGLNRELVAGVVEGIGNRSVDAVLAPEPGQCCERLRPPSSG